MNSVQRKVLMHGGGLLSEIARRRVLVEPEMLVQSPHFGVRVLRKILLKIAYWGRRPWVLP
jgi:hypothetical protein